MRLIFDVTQLAGWQGKLTGIPRVMREVSSRFAGSGDEVIFIGWDAGRHVFWELPIAEVLRKHSEDTTSEKVPTSSGTSLLRTVYRASPAVLRNTVKKIRHATNSAPAKLPVSEGFRFMSDDKVVVLWGEWGDEFYRKALSTAHRGLNIRLYQFVYDMLPLVTPQYSSHSTEGLRAYVNEVYPICDTLVCISESSSRDVRAWLDEHQLAVPNIETIRLGDNFAKVTERKPDNDFFNGDNPYILCVGTIEVRKNHAVLYYACKLAKARGLSLPHLVIVGRRGWQTENLYDLMTQDPETKDQFVFLHNASDEELSWLYKNSLFSVYPSFYEGWGLPVAESIANGTPCIASNTSSIPEIAGPLIDYFSPSSTDECLAAIVALLDAHNLEKAKKRLSKYVPASWDQTYEQTKRIIIGINE